MSDTYALRPLTPADTSFIFNSWLKTFRDANFVRGVRHGLYFENHHTIIERLLQNAAVVVACDEKDPSRILGYAVGEFVDDAFILHWVYVRQNITRNGIGTALVESFNPSAFPVREYSHHTLQCTSLMEKFALSYNPYRMMRHVA